MSRDSDDAKRTAERVAGEKNVSPEARIAAAQVQATAALVEAAEKIGAELGEIHKYMRSIAENVHARG